MSIAASAEDISPAMKAQGAPSSPIPKLCVGVDIVEIERIRKTVARWGERFRRRVYTVAELEYCKGRIESLAVSFAAKEAVSKALGTGMREVSWREIEILPDRRGKPVVYLHGRAKARAEKLGLDYFALSLSHSRDYAVAFVVAI